MSVPLGEELYPADSGESYRTSLAQYSPAVLRGIRDHLELKASARSAPQLVKAIEEYLREPAHRAAAVADVPADLRHGLALLPYVPAAGWHLEDMRDLLRLVGCRAPEKAMRVLLGLGLTVIQAPVWRVQTLRHFDSALNGWEGEQLYVVPHPAAAQQIGVALFEQPERGVTRSVRNVRESDGREFLLRVAVLWQRIAESPLRVTQDSTLFKRDQERLFSDPALASPMFDEIVRLDGIGHLSAVLGKSLGLLQPDPDAGTLRATLGAAWQAPLRLLERRMWHALMAARDWSGTNGDAQPVGSNHLLAKRWAVLLRLAAIRPDSWMSPAQLQHDLQACDPECAAEFAPRGARPFQVVVGRDLSDPRAHNPRGHEPPREVAEWLEAFLLGAMYQLGAVNVAEDAAGGTVVQLSAVGRWILHGGPQPTDPPEFEKTLFVQPTHEVVVYRQGLSPELIGQLASFCRWRGLGAALTLELTPDSVYRGLEFGRTAEEMISILERHSQRPLPPAVIDSVRTWSGRRERLRLYTHATVLEFASAAEFDAALMRGISGDRLNDRMLLVSGERQIPFDVFRLAGARDYRQPPAVCVSASDDGITWSADLARSDLMVGCELVRFAEPLPATDPGAPGLHFRITPASLENAARQGLRAPYLREWFRQRSGLELPASVELMLQATSRDPVVLSQMLVLQTPTAAVADGIEQHPDTKKFVIERLGATTLAITPSGFEEFAAALQRLGVGIKV